MPTCELFFVMADCILFLFVCLQVIHILYSTTMSKLYIECTQYVQYIECTQYVQYIRLQKVSLPTVRNHKCVTTLYSQWCSAQICWWSPSKKIMPTAFAVKYKCLGNCDCKLFRFKIFQALRNWRFTAMANTGATSLLVCYF